MMPSKVADLINVVERMLHDTALDNVLDSAHRVRIENAIAVLDQEYGTNKTASASFKASAKLED